jgi:hypothetical protein
VVLGFELRVYNLEPLYQLFFCDEFFSKIGSHELFAQAGFEL